MHLTYYQPFGPLSRLPQSGRRRLGVNRVRLVIYGLLLVAGLAGWIWSRLHVTAIELAATEERSAAERPYRAARSAALESSPLSSSELLKQGAALLSTPRRSFGMELLAEAKRREPNLRDGHLQLAYGFWLDATEGNDASALKAAEAELETAKQLDPVYPRTYELLAAVYAAQGRATDAAAAASRAKTFAAVPTLTE